MTRPVRLGAVSYLNVRPLVYGLDARPDLVSLRFDVPAECARLLAEGAIDLGMIPTIAYQPSERIVPGVCIGSEGAVASVALFTRRPVSEIRSIALDTSSETSAALTRILCARVFEIAPRFEAHAPDVAAMLARADAALVIGDAALFADPRVHGAEKIDLGEAWTRMTGLPFVWALWAGRPDAADPAVVALLQQAAEEGMAASDRIAAEYCRDEPVRVPMAQQYLRENLAFRLTPAALEGLRTYYREAEALGVIARAPALHFYEGVRTGRAESEPIE
jgi:predicted solute-binding protein